MTDRELHRLGRRELLEILTALREKLDEVTNENEQLRRQLEESRSSLEADTNSMVKAIYERTFGGGNG